MPYTQFDRKATQSADRGRTLLLVVIVKLRAATMTAICRERRSERLVAARSIR